MKLLLDEIVEHPDADHVLRTLEHFLREVSLETVRTEDELIVYGLGPSFRTMNPRDTTVVRATSQASTTTLHTEVNFLASALAGTAAQDEIVRSKIERAFESMKTELRYSAASRPSLSHPIAAETLPPAEPSPVVETLPAITAPNTPAPIEVERVSTEPVEGTREVVQMPSIEAKPEPKLMARLEPKPEAKAEPKLEAKIESKPEPKPQPRVDPKPAPKIDEPVLAAPRQSAPVPSALTMEASPARKARAAMLWILPLLILLLPAAYVLLRHHAVQSLFAANTAEHVASAAVEHRAETPVPPVAAPTPPQPVPAAMPTDIKDWVQAWAAAMNTSDVQAQLAFYATPLDRYFLTPNVTRDQLLKDKQAEIDDRKGVWTFKAENVVVQQQTPSHAVVVLIKHITVKLPPSTIHEQRLKAQLKLKMVDGEWKIVSERTIG